MAVKTPPEIEQAMKYVRDNSTGAVGDAATKVINYAKQLDERLQQAEEKRNKK